MSFINFFQRDDDGRTSAIRSNNHVGGYYQIPLTGGSAISENIWYRVMPNGSNATGSRKEVDVQSLRSDLLDVTGWSLKVLNEGFLGIYTIKSHEGSELKLNNSLPKEIPENIDFVLYPKSIINFIIEYRTTHDSQYMDIGWTNQNTLNPTADNIKQLNTIPPNRRIIIPNSNVDTLFYKMTASTLDTTKSYYISWGEDYTV